MQNTASRLALAGFASGDVLGRFHDNANGSFISPRILSAVCQHPPEMVTLVLSSTPDPYHSLAQTFGKGSAYHQRPIHAQAVSPQLQR